MQVFGSWEQFDTNFGNPGPRPTTSTQLELVNCMGDGRAHNQYRSFLAGHAIWWMVNILVESLLESWWDKMARVRQARDNRFCSMMVK